MKNLILLLLLSTIFVFTACSDSEVTETKCESNNECTGVGEICNLTSGKCEMPFICTDTKSCYDNESDWDKDTNPVLCVLGECKADVCQTNSDCLGENVCNAGKCEAPADCSLVETVKITSLTSIITEGATKDLKVVALNRNGAEVSTGDSFTWNSSETGIVTVSEAGVITGGTTSGVSEITASVCEKTSEALAVQNFAKVEAGKLRVIVMDVTGEKLENASVKILEEVKTTNTEGFVVFDNSEELNNILVTMSEYRSASFFEVSEKDIIVYLNKERLADSYYKAGGFKGKLDFTHPSIKDNGQVRLGLAGASLPGNILDMDFELLLGEPVMTHIEVPGVLSGDYPIPSVLVAGLSDDTSINDTYKVTGAEGDRVFWSWGGKTTMATLLELAPIFMEGLDNIDIGKVLSQIMPIAKTFNHGMKPNQTIAICDKVEDVNDIDKDGNTTELIADFDSVCFPTVNMNLNQPLSLSTQVKFPELLTVNNVKTEAAVAMIATVVEGQGMLPLGLTAGTDKKNDDDFADGKLDDVSLSYAPQHSGVSNSDSMFVVVTMLTDDLTAAVGDNAKRRLSGIIKHFKNGVIEDSIDLSSETYLKLTGNAKVVEDVLTFDEAPGANLYMVNIMDNNGKQWLIYTTKNTVSLADKPQGFVTPFYTVIVQAITLKDANKAFSYSDLLKFNSSNIDSLNRLTSKFSTYQLDEDKF